MQRFSLTGIIRYDANAECYLSHCPELDIFSAGTTPEHAANAIQDAASLFFKHCAQDGILEEALAERGLAVGPENTIALTPASPNFWQISEQGASRAAVRALAPA